MSTNTQYKSIEDYFKDKIDWEFLKKISIRLTSLCDEGYGYIVSVRLKSTNDLIYIQQEGDNDLITTLNVYSEHYYDYIGRFIKYYKEKGIFYTIETWDRDGFRDSKKLKDKVKKLLEYFCRFYKYTTQGCIQPI